MGVYLSAPITEKVSSDNICRNFSYGASSMQGWRLTQEDAHNCIPDFDKDSNVSFFAVYDGHGGAEVAHYCSANLPDYIKRHPLYKGGNLQATLEAAFLAFDQTLTEDGVIRELKILAGVDDEEPEKPEGMSKNEADILRSEADMPLEDLLAKYEGMGGVPQPKLLRKKKGTVNSPMLKSKKMSKDDKTDSSNTNDNAESDSHSTWMEDKLANGHAENENNLNMEKECQRIKEESVEGNDSKSVDIQECDTSVRDSGSVSKTIQSDGTDSASSSEAKPLVCLVQNSSISSTDNSSESQHKGFQSIKCDESSEADSTSNDLGTPGSSRSGSNIKNHSSHLSVSSDMSRVSSEAMSSSSKSSEYDPLIRSTHNEAEAGSSSSHATGAGSSSGGSGCKPEGASSTSSGKSAEAGSSSSSSKSFEEQEAAGSSSGGSSAGGSKQIPEDDEDDDDDENYEEELSDEDLDSDDDEDVEFDSEDEDIEEEEEEDDDSGEEDSMMEDSNYNEQHNEEPGYDSGSTAVVAVMKDKEIVVANVGDSRCVLCRDGKALDLSFDHKPEDAPERKRIEEAGGKVTQDGRVNGGLNLSRALGDHFYKRNKSKSDREQMITALPDLQTATLQEEDEFLVLACDGIWNYMSSQEVVDFVKKKLALPEYRERLSKICEDMFDYCLAPNTTGDGTGCDNMTCIIVSFEQMWKSNKNKRSVSLLETNSDDQPQKRPKLDEDVDDVGT